jgi:ribulose 1,5-bisphosphate synthetase/thiazole synthase
MEADVVIVGAGLSGMIAARTVLAASGACPKTSDAPH